MSYKRKNKPSVFSVQSQKLVDLQPQFLKECQKNAKRDGISQSDVEDFVQTCYLNALNSLNPKTSTVRVRTHYMNAFIHAIYLNALRSHHRNMRRKLTESSIQYINGKAQCKFDSLACLKNRHPLGLMIIAQQMKIVTQALSKNARSLKVLTLYAQGFTQVQISQELGLTQTNMNQLVHRGKKASKSMLKKHGMSLYDEQSLYSAIGKGEQDDE
jgi:RNA polymerase sigma factor (sigma-70 family)